jgi:hypothetical protein
MTQFERAVKASPLLRNFYQRGLQALRSDNRAKIHCKNPGKLTGSVDLDRGLAKALPNDRRWDYGIGYRRSSRELAIWVEFHPASSSNVGEVLKKLEWLKSRLENQAPELWSMSGGRFFWVATDGCISLKDPHKLGG